MYKAKLDYFREYFVKYSLKHLDDCANIAHDSSVGVRQDNFQSIFAVLELVPAGVGLLASLVKNIIGLSVYTSKVEASGITRLFIDLTGEQKEVLLSEGILRAAAYFGETIDRLNKEEVGSLANVAANKFFSVLKKSYTEIKEINPDIIISAIFEQQSWSEYFVNKNHFVKGPIIDLKYLIISKEGMDKFYEQSSTLSVKEFFITNAGLNEDTQVLFHEDIIIENKAISQDMSYIAINYPQLLNKKNAQRVVDFYSIPTPDGKFIEISISTKIKNFFDQKQDRNLIQVLYGLVGTGKTQIVRWYGNKYKGNYQNRVRYIEAESKDKLDEGFKVFAEDLKLDIGAVER